jgi:hypothetical protein
VLVALDLSHPVVSCQGHSMAEPHCAICDLMGYSTCDICGGVCFTRDPSGIDVCAYCVESSPMDDRPADTG